MKRAVTYWNEWPQKSLTEKSGKPMLRSGTITADSYNNNNGENTNNYKEEYNVSCRDESDNVALKYRFLL